VFSQDFFSLCGLASLQPCLHRPRQNLLSLRSQMVNQMKGQRPKTRKLKVNSRVREDLTSNPKVIKGTDTTKKKPTSILPTKQQVLLSCVLHEYIFHLLIAPVCRNWFIPSKSSDGVYGVWCCMIAFCSRDFKHIIGSSPGLIYNFLSSQLSRLLLLVLAFLLRGYEKLMGQRKKRMSL
jgi:hypothetical protein